MARFKGSCQQVPLTTTNRKFLIAIDLGTTFSAMSWAQTRKPKDIEVITQWPTTASAEFGGKSSEKVPTELMYEDGFTKWGFQLQESDRRYQLFKLHLDEGHRYKSTKFPGNLHDARGLLPGHDKTVEKLMSDYLQALRKHAEQILRHRVPQSALNSISTEYILTVPAMWTESAKAKTKAAALEAGMEEVSLIAEPEAGAIYALDNMPLHNLRIGNRFMVVDAGGGTVDVITYQIQGLDPRLQVSEATSGSGALCGASFLNRKFQDMMKAKFAKNRNWNDEAMEEATERFEEVVKRNFIGDREQSFTIPVLGLLDSKEHSISRGRYKMTGDEVREIFEPIVLEVIALIRDQLTAVDNSVSAIILVGGFGQNTYLYSKLQEAFRGTSSMQSVNSWTAVVRGALMMGLASATNVPSITVSSRKARKNYGVEYHVTFEAGKHDEAQAFFTDFSGESRIIVMKWFVRLNDRVQEQHPSRVDMYYCEPVEDGPPNFIDVTIHTCTDPVAPMYCEGHVEELVKVRADLRSLLVHTFEIQQGADGADYCYLTVELAITHLSAFTKYELIYNRKTYGTVEAEYV